MALLWRSRFYHQLTLLIGVEPFDLALTDGGNRPGGGRFIIDQVNWSAASGITCPFRPAVMFQNPFFQVGGDAGVEAVVTASDHIDIPGIQP